MSRLSCDDGLALLGIARRAISSVVIENCLPDFPPFSDPLSVLRGAFVTLYRGGKLRGCVGQVEDPGPLAEAVARAAINSALHDPRFPPWALRKSHPWKLKFPYCHLSSRSRRIRLSPASMGYWWFDLHSEDCCFRRSPRSGDGPASDCWKKPAPKLVCPGTSGGILTTQVFAFTAEVFSEAELRAISRA